MIALGVPIKAVQKRLGHSRPDGLLDKSSQTICLPLRFVFLEFVSSSIEV
jgi:hypothetical protein